MIGSDLPDLFLDFSVALLLMLSLASSVVASPSVMLLAVLLLLVAAALLEILHVAPQVTDLILIAIKKAQLKLSGTYVRTDIE